MTDQLRAALAAMKEQLAWRGPTGRALGHVVLERPLAQAIVEELERLLKQESKPQ